MIVAVTGATGLVGEFLVTTLLDKGHLVKGMVHRTKPAVAGFEAHPNLAWHDATLSDMDSLLRLVEGCDAVVHSAFHHVPGRYRGGEGDDPDKFRTINGSLTERFLERLAGAGIRRTVFVSSRAVFDGYGDGHEYVSDAAARQPTSLYGEIKARTEAFGSGLAGIGFCSIRPTGIYGLRKRPALSKWWELVSETLRGSIPSTQRSLQLKTEVHGDDVANAINLLLNAPIHEIEGKGFNCSDVAISEAQLVEMAEACKDGRNIDLDALSEGIPPLNPMACDGLRALGWEPGGMAQVVQTIQRLVDFQKG